MNKEKFSNMVSHPFNVSKESIKELQEVVDNFPYCQTARVILAKAQLESNSMHSHASIKKASLYAIDRKHLKKFIESKAPMVENKAMVPKPIAIPEIKETTSTPPPTAKKEEKEETKDVQKEIIAPKVEHIPSPEEIKEVVSENSTEQTGADDKFLTEVEKNLKALQEAKAKANSMLDKPIKIVEKQKSSEPSKKEEKEEKEGRKKEKIEVKKSTTSSEQPLEEKTEKKTTKKPAIKKKQEDKKPENIEYPKLNLQDEILGYELFSSRYGEGLQEKDELATPYTREFHPDLFFEKKTIRQEKKKAASSAIIDKFIATEPTITPIKEKKKDIDPSEDLSAQSSTLKGTLATENMANIYVKQGNNKKAIAIFEALILKYPEKKTYFADQISKLK